MAKYHSAKPNITPLRAHGGGDCSRFARKALDFVEAFFRDELAVDHPAAAYRVNLVAGKVFGEVKRVHSAGRNKLDANERRGESLYRFQAAVNRSREEFDYVYALVERANDFRGGYAAGKVRTDEASQNSATESDQPGPTINSAPA